MKIDTLKSKPDKALESNGLIAELLSTEVVTVTTETTIKEGLDLLTKHDVNLVYLLDDTQSLLGIITDYSLLKAILSGQDAQNSIKILLSRDVPVASAETPIHKAASLLRGGAYAVLAVLDQGKFLGEVSRNSVLKSLWKQSQSKMTTANNTENDSQNVQIRLDSPHSAPKSSPQAENSSAKNLHQ